MSTTAGSRRRDTGANVALIAILAGAAVSVALGVYSSVHEPTDKLMWSFGFNNLIAMKVWLATGVGVLVIVQLVLALWMYGKLGIHAPSWVGPAHRTVGTVALILSLPVAYHCLWAIGFEHYNARSLIHSIAGCLVYGVFVAKVIGLHRANTPGWLVTVMGSLLFLAITVAVLTSAVWYFQNFGLPSTNTHPYG